jgi:hypothetical protein
MMPLLVSPTAKQGIRHQPIGSMMQVSWNRSSRQEPVSRGCRGQAFARAWIDRHISPHTGENGGFRRHWQLAQVPGRGWHRAVRRSVSDLMALCLGVFPAFLIPERSGSGQIAPGTTTSPRPFHLRPPSRALDLRHDDSSASLALASWPTFAVRRLHVQRGHPTNVRCWGKNGLGACTVRSNPTETLGPTSF